MTALTDRVTHQSKDAANFVLGLWPAISAWALSYAHETTPALACRARDLGC
jgi:SPW repeat